MKQFSLEDIFRKRYPRQQAYTFARGLSKSRIDYFCISTLLDCYVNDASIHHFPFSDHDAVALNINLNKSLNGPGIWKMNAQTIQTHVFRESLEKLWPTWTDKINEYENILLWWEITKINIKQLTIEISKTLNTSEYEINKIEKRLNKIKDSDKFIHKSECISLKHTIKEYYEKQTEAAKIRSRVKIFEEGEKSTRYFFNLDKHNISNKYGRKLNVKMAL